MSTNVSLLSPYPLAECVALLHAAIDAERIFANPFAGSDTKPVIGRISSPFIYLHKRIAYRNSFQTYLTAKLTPQAGGTAIIGEMGSEPITRAFMIAANGFVILIGAAMTFAAVLLPIATGARQQQDAWIAVAAPACMVAFNFGLYRFCRYLARDEARFLKDFLIKTLDGQEYGGQA